MRTVTTRTIAGGVAGTTGAIKSGAGFSAQRTGTGAYTIRFAQPLTVAGIVASVFQGASNIVQVTSFSSTQFTAVCSATASGAASDADWSFIATGAA